MAIFEHAVDHLSRAEVVPKTGRPRGLARTIRRVAILGAGTMGARVASHFANAGVAALLLSRAKNEANRSITAVKAIEGMVKQKPANFFADDFARLVKPGNYDDHFEEITNCDWVIETVAEDLAIKRDLWRRVEAVAKSDTILSTCTSGIQLARICEGFSAQFRRNFLGTHFFNPTRYLHLLEVIPGPETDPAVLAFVEEFGDRRLGKGVVVCKDTTNFVANRMGAFFGATVAKIAQEDGYSIEEVDALTGSLIGLPSTASYRLLDLVGLDIWAAVLAEIYEGCPADPWRERFQLAAWQREMINRGWLGEKTKQGFYKKVVKGEEKQILVIDPATLEYQPVSKPRFPEVDATAAIEDVPERLAVLMAGRDRAGAFLWKLFSDYFLYAAERIPEITDRLVDVDRAMRGGYAHKYGPFEMWDALGFENVVARLEREGRAVPDNIREMRARGAKSLYRFAEDQTKHKQYFDFLAKDYAGVETLPGAIVLADVKRANGVIKKNAGASLVDLGDGVICCEFHSKMNAIGEDIISMLNIGLVELSRNFEAMVIANEGENFSVGANLVPLLLAAQEGEWDELNEAVDRLQQTYMALKYASKPVVSAPFARTLGGGSELVLHTVPQVSAELYMGQVELGVGLIPAGGGCKELMSRHQDARKVFELIGFAKVSMSAEEAKNLGFIDKCTPVTMNPERLVADAKALALSLAPNWVPGVPRTNIKVPGDAGYALMKLGVWTARQGEYISDYDCVIGEKLAYVLAGGRSAGEQLVSEQYLLDLEREAFLSLLGNAKTQERIAYILKTGKPLRN